MAKKTFSLPDPLFFFDAILPTRGDSYFAIMERNNLGTAVPGTNFMRHDGNGWHYVGEVQWSAVTIAPLFPPINGMLVGGVDGDIAIVRDNRIDELHFSDICKIEFTPRRMQLTAQGVFTVGYGGVLFNLNQRLDWAFEKFTESPEASWIEAIDLDLEGVRYLVGLNGEIWSDFGGSLRRIASPTNADLNSVCCASSGITYICGSGGALMMGAGDKWEIVDAPSGFSDDFWRVVEFDERIWVSSMNHVFEWRDDALVLSDFGASHGIGNYYNLRRNESELFVVDEKHVLTFTGDESKLFC